VIQLEKNRHKHVIIRPTNIIWWKYYKTHRTETYHSAYGDII